MAGGTSKETILIAGAGIAGLTLAVALARHGIACRVLERRNVLSEDGAGIQLGPNAMKVLQRLGVAERLSPLATKPEAIEVADGASGRQLARMPLGAWIERQHGAPYWVAHRADLQSALAAAVREAAGIELKMGFELTAWKEDRDGVIAEAADGRLARGRLMVGADGIWSAIRRRLFPDHPLTYAGKLAARTVLPMPSGDTRFSRGVTGVWLGQDAHVVHYPIRAGREIAVVVIVDEATQREDWGSAIEATRVLARLIRFSPELLGFLGLAKEWRAWSLYDPPPLPAWSDGKVGLIGDAAHPILPFFAQGGAMALEDAEALADGIARHADKPEAAFGAFERARKMRVVRVQDASRSNGVTFHLGGAMALARNATLRVVPGSLLMRRYGWLYGGGPTA